MPTAAPAVLEHEDVLDAVELLQRGGAVAPLAHDRGHLVVVEVGHRPQGIVVVADDLGGARRPARAVELVARSTAPVASGENTGRSLVKVKTPR